MGTFMFQLAISHEHVKLEPHQERISPGLIGWESFKHRSHFLKLIDLKVSGFPLVTS